MGTTEREVAKGRNRGLDGKQCQLFARCTIEAAIDAGRLGTKPRSTEVVLGERSKGMNGIDHPPISLKTRVFRFGSKGLLMV